MTMFRKLMVLMVSAVACHSAFAAREVHHFDVFVTIPSQAFYVIPADPAPTRPECRLPDVA